MIDCILKVDCWDDLINAVSCVLEDIASKVVDVRMMIRNKCPWALYVSKVTGRRWATFIARAKFKGYHLKFQTNYVVCTNLETGKQYKVGLDFCSCAAFKHSMPNDFGKKAPCKHIKLLWELGSRVTWADAIAPELEQMNVNQSDRPQYWHADWALPTLINSYG